MQQAFATWAGKPDYICLQPIMMEECLPTHLIQQAIGALVSYFACTGIRVNCNETYLNQALAKIKKWIDPRDMAEEIERKTLELGLRSAPLEEFESPS